MFSEAPPGCADNDASFVPTIADVGLTFPVAVLSVDDAARLAGQRLVVPVSADDHDSLPGYPSRSIPHTRRRRLGLELACVHQATREGPAQRRGRLSPRRISGLRY